jgi:Icc-related predicted phosphoesterase
VSWALSIPTTDKEKIDEAIDAAHDCYAVVYAGNQLDAAKAAAKELAKLVTEPQVSISMCGHVHDGVGDASTSLSVYVSGYTPVTPAESAEAAQA